MFYRPGIPIIRCNSAFPRNVRGIAAQRYHFPAIGYRLCKQKHREHIRAMPSAGIFAILTCHGRTADEPASPCNATGHT